MTKPKNYYYDRLQRREQYLKNLERDKAYSRAKGKEVVARLFDLLGRKCSNPNCLVPGGCSDVRCLQFDHIEGGGMIERLNKFKSNNMMYRYYAANPEEAKKRLQVLCANCNWIKRKEKGEERHPQKHYPKKQLEVVPLTQFTT